jgi:biotin operon repressor
MKKKDREKKKDDMPEFEFRKFTPEEDKIYEDAINAFRATVAGGKILKVAYDGFPIEDAELRAVIQADFLKILIAERHFAANQSFDEIAAALGISRELVQQTHARMLQEAGISVANEFGQQVGQAMKDTDD